MDVKSFIKAARLRTLPLSISGIIVGSYLGVEYLNSILTTNSIKIVVWLTPIFWLAILTTIGFQVLSNFANDYGDFVKGYLCIGTYYVASIPSTGHYLKRLRASIGQIWHILTFLSVLFRLRCPIFFLSSCRCCKVISEIF